MYIFIILENMYYDSNKEKLLRCNRRLQLLILFLLTLSYLAYWCEQSNVEKLGPISVISSI